MCGKGEGLSHQSGYHYLCSLHHHVGAAELRPLWYSQDMGNTFGSMIGRFIVPFFSPIGWVLADCSGTDCRHLCQGSGGVFHSGALRGDQHHLHRGHGLFDERLSAIGFGPLNAYCLMTFSLLYVPCAATLATIKKETGSWKWWA